ncbi:alpha/beta fold hydrolase [Pseudonocardia pini]|uniref:alpha/beta fold hydrolase n=1 Tax=Pseudonocardia pini TaxID=2758030 RepID=UPI0028B15FD2|nr:alpha/beta hydrolase [Pseudonocardia pini]
MSAHPQGGAHIARLPDGRELFYRELPGGGPTVVFEAGRGATRSTWGLVQPPVGVRVRAVAYDRSGLGASPATAGPRRLQALATDLGALLDHLGDGPFVLVGHSWGGPVVRLAAAARPDRVRGLVLVDPTDEACPGYFTPRFASREVTQNRLLPPIARTGLLRRAFAPALRALPPVVRAEARAESYTPAAVATLVAEGEATVADLQALLDAPPDLGDLPVTVVSGTRAAGLGRRNRAELVEAHASRASTSPHGRHVRAERSGHLVMLTEPELLVSEIARFS